MTENTNRSFLAVIIGVVLVVVLGLLVFPRQTKALLPTTPSNLSSPSSGTVVVPMVPVNARQFNQSGTATLKEDNGKVTVTINLNTPDSLNNQPVHIHAGACPGVGPVIYPLNNVINGKSTTVLNASLSQLKQQQPLAINAHESLSQIDVYTACGQVNLP